MAKVFITNPETGEDVYIGEADIENVKYSTVIDGSVIDFSAERYSLNASGELVFDISDEDAEKLEALFKMLTEAESVDDIQLRYLPYYQNRALLRLMLVANAKTVQYMTYATNDLTKYVREAARDGVLDQNDYTVVVSRFNESWTRFMDRYTALFNRATFAAANIAMSEIAGQHDNYIYNNEAPRRTDNAAVEENAQTNDPYRTAKSALDLERDRVVAALKEKIYNDGYNLSRRIWKMGEKNRQAIDSQINRLFHDPNMTPQDVINQLEAFLGANADCPRWTRERLYKLTPTDRLASKTGLLSNNPCSSKGMAWNATRLIRNEITIFYNGVKDAMLAATPWIEEEQIKLSPLHPPIGCECETIVVGGRDGKGIYPKGTITIPIHVQCMCLKLPVLPDKSAVGRRMRDYVDYSVQDGDMGDYAAFLGVDRSALSSLSLKAIGAAMIYWLYSEPDKLFDL